MKALGFIETKGLVPAIESADAMLKAAEVTLVERTFVKGGLVTITIAGDVAACKASVDAAASAVTRMGGTIISTHVIPRPHETLDGLIVKHIPGEGEEESEDDDESHPFGGGGQITEKKERTPVETAPKEEKKPAPVKADGPLDRKKLEALVKKDGFAAALEILSKTRVVDLRSLAREFNGEFGIAGREITHANKKALVDEFRKFFKK